MIKGAYTAIVTPFKADESLDEQGLQSLIRFQAEAGIDGIVVLGTTGESPTLTEEEQEQIISIAAKETKGKMALMVGTGSYSTQQAIEKSKRALRLGADSLLIVTPYYNKPTQEGVYQHFKAIAEAVALPIVLYNTEARTGRNIETKTVRRLAEIPNIVGIKESSGDMEQIEEVVEQIASRRADFTILSGIDALTMPLMAMGGHGVISVAANLIPGAIKKLVDEMTKERYVSARELHYQMLPFLRSNFVETNPAPIKAAMRLCGMPAGRCRLPLCELTSHSETIVKEALTRLCTIFGPIFGEKPSASLANMGPKIVQSRV